jgi:metal-sulfur cluster biosynthetic enzyme
VEPNRDEILRALEGVSDPELRQLGTQLDMVRDVEIDGGDVRITIALTVAGCPPRDSFQEQVVSVMRDVRGVERVALGFDVMTAEERQASATKLRGGVEARSKGLSLDAFTRVPVNRARDHDTYAPSPLAAPLNVGRQELRALPR